MTDQYKPESDDHKAMRHAGLSSPEVAPFEAAWLPTIAILREQLRKMEDQLAGINRCMAYDTRIDELRGMAYEDPEQEDISLESIRDFWLYMGLHARTSLRQAALGATDEGHIIAMFERQEPPIDDDDRIRRLEVSFPGDGTYNEVTVSLELKTKQKKYFLVSADADTRDSVRASWETE